MSIQKVFILTIILTIIIILGLYIADKTMKAQNKDYCLNYNFDNCPEGRCHSAYCPDFTGNQSACCPR